MYGHFEACGKFFDCENVRRFKRHGGGSALDAGNSFLFWTTSHEDKTLKGNLASQPTPGQAGVTTV